MVGGWHVDMESLDLLTMSLADVTLCLRLQFVRYFILSHHRAAVGQHVCMKVIACAVRNAVSVCVGL